MLFFGEEIDGHQRYISNYAVAETLIIIRNLAIQYVQNLEDICL